MAVTALKCPTCGASLEPPRLGTAATCGYCGATAQVAPPARAPGMIVLRPAPAAPARAGSAGTWIAVSLLGTLVMTGAGAYMALRHAAIPPSAAVAEAPPVVAAPPRPYRWHASTAPLLADIDGDGTAELLGQVASMETTPTWSMVALGAADGALRWRSASLGARDAVSGDGTFVVGDLVVQPLRDGGLVALALRDGSTRWQVALRDAFAHACAGEAPGEVVVVTRDQVRHRLELATGRELPPAPAPALAGKGKKRAAPPACARLVSAHGDGAPGSVPIVDSWAARVSLAGMTVQLVATLAPGDVVLAGQRSPGTAVPTLARATRKGDVATARWTVEVPREAPLQATFVDHLAVDAAAAYVPYQTRSGEVRLGAFELTTGARQWDVAVGDSPTVSGLTLTPTLVMVATWSGLWAYDRATGALRWQLT